MYNFTCARSVGVYTVYMLTLKEKRKALRDFAQSIGLCNRCTFKEADGGRASCSVCRKAASKYAAKNRATPGRCNRCGQVNPRASTHKTCPRCYTYSKK